MLALTGHTSGRDTLASSGSCHHAKAAAFRCLSGSSRCRLTRSNVGDPPPSLHGRYSASSLLRGSAPLAGASVLSASRLEPLVPFPLASPCRFSRSIGQLDAHEVAAGYVAARPVEA